MTEKTSSKLSRGLASALAARTEADEVEAEMPPDIEGFAYRVILKDGVTFEAISNLEPEELARTLQKYRKADDLWLWEDGQATEARSIVHLAPVVDDDDDEEETPDAGVPEEAGAGGGEDPNAGQGGDAGAAHA